MHPMIRIAATFALCVGPATTADPAWRPAFEDDFERNELGNAWIVRGQATIEHGRLQLIGPGSVALIARPFAADVRLEFDAAAWPGAPPCDLSATIAAHPDRGYTYLLAFGGQNNRVNQLIGPGVHLVDEKPPLRIEPGRTYHLVATREGRRLTYEVDGRRVLEAPVENIVGGPGFDHVGLVTWAGMLADNVRVYERVTPHPDTPSYLTSLPGLPIEREGRTVRTVDPRLEAPARPAIEALAAGRFEDARAAFDSLADPLARLAGLSSLFGDLNYIERPGDLSTLAAEWRKAAAADPGDATLATYARAADHFGRLTMSRAGDIDATLLVQLGPAHNPFYWKARLYQARYLYWNGREGGDPARIRRAVEWMNELKSLWPDNRVLREYTGQDVPWGEELTADTATHPAWAAFLREAYARQIAIMRRWFALRQAPDGQLGGGWGDDVELMRTWIPIAGISTGAGDVTAGIERLAHGVWGICRDGYANEIGDVEHTAEPSADVLPGMMFLRYGDPLYVEWNLRTARTIRERFMAIDANGYPRFRSSEFGAPGVHDAGGDTGYHARAMKHFLWLAWRGSLEARDWFVAWADGWRAATMLDLPDKPAGVPPSSIWYPDGGIVPPGAAVWYDEKRNYYGPRGLPQMVFDALLSAAWLSGDSRFTEAFETMMDLATRGPLPGPDPAPGSPEWNRAGLAHVPTANHAAVYRLLTGSGVYDEYLRRNATAFQRYVIDRDLGPLLQSFEHTARSLRVNLWLQTTEVLSTDRAALPGALDVFGAYTGAVQPLTDAQCPTFAVTYETPDPDFAALVVESGPRRLRVWLYGFWPAPTRVVLRPWLLETGEYVLMHGEQLAGERPLQHRYAWAAPERVRILHRAEPIDLVVPPRKVYVADLRLARSITVPARACDLAIGPRDVQREPDSIKVTVHNIGNAPAEEFDVALQQARAGRWETVTQSQVRRLPDPQGFVPYTATVRLPIQKPQQELRIAVDPADELYELCEDNNIVALGP